MVVIMELTHLEVDCIDLNTFIAVFEHFFVLLLIRPRVVQVHRHAFFIVQLIRLAYRPTDYFDDLQHFMLVVIIIIIILFHRHLFNFFQQVVNKFILIDFEDEKAMLLLIQLLT